MESRPRCECNRYHERRVPPALADELQKPQRAGVESWRCVSGRRKRVCYFLTRSATRVALISTTKAPIAFPSARAGTETWIS